MRRILTLLIAVLMLQGAALAAPPEPLTRRERKEAVSKLPEKHRQFLIDVEPILADSERDTFLTLETDPQREAFIDDFWRRRDLMRGTTNDSARKEYYEHLAFVKETYGQVSSDPGRIYLIHGPPSVIVPIKCSRHFVPIEVWRYAYLPGFGHDMLLLFYLPNGERIYRLWNPMEIAGAGRVLLSDAIDATRQYPENLVHTCQNGEVLAAAMAFMKRDALRMMKVFEAPKVEEEDVDRILRSSVLARPGAPPLTAEISIAFPAADGRKTDAQITILVPRAQLATTAAGGVSVYTLDVVGEIIRDGLLYDKYRYRFDFPGDITNQTLPIVIDRMLRPNQYTSRVKITDPASGAEKILESELKVPEVPIAQQPTAETATLDMIREDLHSTRAGLRIVPLQDGVTSGVQTIETIASGSGIKAVEFWLDGKRVATRRSPPFTLDLDFGTVPKLRRVRVVALDSHEQPITGDEVIVNAGTEPFRVRITSPRVAPKLSGQTRVAIDVRVPEGKKLANVELYWNESRLSTMFDPPFVQTVEIPKADGVGYLRAVARLDDPEIDPVEDIVMVNTPDYMETIDVHLIELPTTVLADGKPVDGLLQSSFKVFDDGQPVEISKFEQVKNLPLSIGMAVDTSGSMDQRIKTAREAGAAFFENVLRPGDKAFVVAFDSQPHTVQKWTSDRAEIFAGLAKLRPEQSTALYDAVVYSLYNFLGVKGQRALVLLSDGRDTVSKFTFNQTLEYAQRAAVPIYTVGIGVGRTELDVRMHLNRLASETGGTSYYIENAAELTKIYSDIQNELRSQYVLGFYPAASVKPGGKWREVTVQAAAGRVKTIRGYYP